MKLAITSSQTILQKGMCKQQLHHHLQMYALMFLHHLYFLTLLLPYIVKDQLTYIYIYIYIYMYIYIYIGIAITNSYRYNRLGRQRRLKV